MKTSWRTQIWIGIGCLLAYWFLMTLVPVPDGNPPNVSIVTAADRTRFIEMLHESVKQG